MSRWLPWPLPALLAWGGAWLAYAGLQRWLPAAFALALACALGTAASLLGQGWWRRGLIAAGFPLSLVLTGAATGVPAHLVRLDGDDVESESAPTATAIDAAHYPTGARA